MLKRLYSSILLLLICSLSIDAANVRLTVSPQRGKNRIETGDLFYLNIEVTNITESPSTPNLPGAKLNYFDRTFEQSGFSSVNGQTTQSYSATYTATFRAQKEGSYSFGPISVGGVKSNQIKYTISPKSDSQSSSASQKSQNQNIQSNNSDDNDKPKYIGKGDGNLFLRATVSKSTAYEQEALVYTVKLYTTYDAIKFVGATAAPKFDGFVVEESKDISSSLALENYQGKSYATAVIARYIIFPQMAGSLKITGNTYTIAVDRREYYHDAFWGNMSFSTPLQLNVTPNDLVVNVKNLPAPKPIDFSGAVGNFSISSQLKSAHLKSNQAASIVYTLKGAGNIKYAQLPDLAALYPPEIEIYTPKIKQDIDVGGSNVTGTVVFDYSFMPQEEGKFRIPDVKFVYFNPETGKYESSVAKGYDINVGKGDAGSKSSSRYLRFDSKLENVRTDKINKINRPIIYGFIYWLVYLIPVIILIIIIIARKIYIANHADMVAFNSRRANKIARKRLKKALAAMKSNNRELFYDELLSALWGYLGDKLKMPTSELLRDNVRTVLVEKEISEINIDKFISMIDNAEFTKYSPSKDADDLGRSYNEATEIINTLEKEFQK